MSATPATLDRLLAEMHDRQAVLGGWDAVLSLVEECVNEFVRSHWTAMTDNRGKQTGTVLWFDGVSDQAGEQRRKVVQVAFEFGEPAVQLQSGTDLVSIRQSIGSGKLRVGTLNADNSHELGECPCEPNDPSVNWLGAPANIDVSSEAFIEGTVPLRLIQSPAAGVQTVAVDFAAGEFALRNFNHEAVNNEAFVQKLQGWFARSKVHYVVASIDSSGDTSAATLRPASLKLNVTRTNSGNNILQLLMATAAGSQPDSTAIAVDEPIPTGNGSTYSLMITSKVLVRDIIVDGFNRGIGQVKLVAVAPTTPGNAWCATTRNPMEYGGSIRCDGVFDEIENKAELGMRFGGSVRDGLSLFTYTSPGANIQLQLALSANFPIKLSGNGRDQQIRLTAGPA